MIPNINNNIITTITPTINNHNGILSTITSDITRPKKIDVNISSNDPVIHVKIYLPYFIFEFAP